MAKAFGDHVTQLAEQLHLTCERNAMAVVQALQNTGDTSIPHHLYVALAGAAAMINLAARLMSEPCAEPEDDDAFNKWMDTPTSRKAMLAAAVMLARSAIPTKSGVTIEYSPQNIKAALEVANTVTGNTDLSMFSQKMVEAALKYQAPEDFFDNSPSAAVIDLRNYRGTMQ